MRYLLPVQATLAALLALPVLVPSRAADGQGAQPPGLSTLEHALSDTVRALEELAGLQDRLARPAATPDEATRAIAEALRRSESPAEAGLELGPELDARLASLREEVARLEQLFGELAARGDLEPGMDPSALRIPAGALAEDLGLRPVPTKGLDRELLREIGGEARGRASFLPQASRGGAPAGTALEAPDYSADPLRLARALYRAGRFDEALAALPAEHASAEMRWWRGRALERLERLEEADACWRALAADAQAGAWAERAKSDLEFLEWKRARTLAIPEDASTTSAERER